MSIDAAPRLRAPRPLGPPFQVILVEPEIPPNTGNIARLCAATGSVLHLVEPLGFRIDEHAVRRAGLDYWHLVTVCAHPSFDRAQADAQQRGTGRCWFFTAHAERSYLEVPWEPGDSLVFGKESVGLPQSLVDANHEYAVAIPTIGAVRSLNLANSVSIALYEAIRSVGWLGKTHLEP